MLCPRCRIPMHTTKPDVAVLFARADSIYKTLPGVDVYDIERDARTYDGPWPVVAHPPCRAWGRLRQFAKPRDDEKALAPWAVEQVRRWGGVLEHPAGSTLWPDLALPEPGRGIDAHGGSTLAIHQHWWGHRAEKATRLYICGVQPDRIPDIPMVLGGPTHCIRPTKSYPRLPSVTKAEREHTPPDFARWLVDLARRVTHAALAQAVASLAVPAPEHATAALQFEPGPIALPEIVCSCGASCAQCYTAESSIGTKSGRPDGCCTQ